MAQSTGKVTLFNLSGCKQIAIVNSLDWAKQTVDLYKETRGSRKATSRIYQKKAMPGAISKRSSHVSSAIVEEEDE